MGISGGWGGSVYRSDAFPLLATLNYLTNAGTMGAIIIIN